MELVKAGIQDLRVVLKPQHIAAFEEYYRLLVQWNEKFNLTAITDYEGAQVRHFLDSLSCLLALESGNAFAGKRMIDVGTGAGFPGLPLKIFEPTLRLTLLEATAKKVRFLEHVVGQLGLQNVTVLHGRAEELGQDPQHRERYDWVVARAVAEMSILAEYLLPLARIGGHALAQKGEDAAAEVQRAEFAIRQLGGHVRRLVPVELRGLAETRHLVLLDKVAATPEKYPRRSGMPVKRPLTP
ncbi:MAG: 16S rRNA (guanine(527)-N(7))-methyltransferase RsmG [Anaerolineales bacterium]